MEEEREEYRILAQLTAMVESYGKEIFINIETMDHYEFLFVKAKYSKAIDGRSVALNTEGIIDIRQARHPLIGKSAVRLDAAIGRKYP